MSRHAGGPACCSWCQQKENAQPTRIQCRRIARLERTWKSARPSSFFPCLYSCSARNHGVRVPDPIRATLLGDPWMPTPRPRGRLQLDHHIP
jgi:hypothetical protein